jgi:hypothetical protein
MQRARRQSAASISGCVCVASQVLLAKECVGIGLAPVKADDAFRAFFFAACRRWRGQAQLYLHTEHFGQSNAGLARTRMISLHSFGDRQKSIHFSRAHSSLASTPGIASAPLKLFDAHYLGA